jgi:hypothetical protein
MPEKGKGSREAGARTSVRLTPTRIGEEAMKATIERQTMKKVYLRLLPFCFVLYFICYLDRVNIGFAALTMNKDIGLSSYVFGLGAGAFFWGFTVRCLPDGRWFDATRHNWRNGRGRPARWPDLEAASQMRRTRVILAAGHLDHDPGNNRLRNLKSLCQRCHPIHDRPHHLARRQITDLLRRTTLGDLFLGPYSVCFGLRASSSTLPSDGQCPG